MKNPYVRSKYIYCRICGAGCESWTGYMERVYCENPRCKKEARRRDRVYSREGGFFFREANAKYLESLPEGDAADNVVLAALAEGKMLSVFALTLAANAGISHPAVASTWVLHAIDRLVRARRIVGRWSNDGLYYMIREVTHDDN